MKKIISIFLILLLTFQCIIPGLASANTDTAVALKVGQSYKLTNSTTSSATMSWTGDGTYDYVVYNADHSIANYNAKRKSSLTISKTQYAIITVAEGNKPEATLKTGLQILEHKVAALVHQQVAPGETYFYKNYYNHDVSGKVLNGAEVEVVTYKENKNLANSSTGATSMSTKSTDETYFTNSGNETITVIFPSGAVGLQKTTEPAYQKYTVTNTETVRISSVHSAAVAVRGNGKFDYLKYDNDGVLIETVIAATSFSISPNTYYLVQASEEPVELYAAVKHVKYQAAVKTKLVEQHAVAPNATLELVNPKNYNVKYKLLGKLQTLKYSADGKVKDRAPNTTSGNYTLGANEKALLTNAGTETIYVQVPYEHGVVKNSDVAAFEKFEVLPNSSLAFTKTQEQSQFIVNGTSYEITIIENAALKSTKVYDGERSFTLRDGEKMVVKNLATDKVAVTANHGELKSSQSILLSHPSRMLAKFYSEGINAEFNDFYGNFNNANGTFVGSEYVNVEQVLLGEPDRNTMVSLPTGSFVVLGYDKPLIDMPNEPDLFIEESGKNPVEEASVTGITVSGKRVDLGIIQSGIANAIDFAAYGVTEPIIAVGIVGLDDNGRSPGYDVVMVSGYSSDEAFISDAGKEALFKEIAAEFEALTNPDVHENMMSGFPGADKYGIALRSEIAIYSHFSDPIDTASGAQVLDLPLVSLTGARELALTISYNSLLLQNTDFGKAWYHNYSMSLKPATNTITVNWTPYREEVFTRNEEGIYEGQTATITQQGEQFVVKTNKLEQFIFNKNGQLVTHIDAQQKALQLSYNDQNQLTNIHDPLSDVAVTIKYNALGQVSSITDSLNRSATFRYDAANNLTTIVTIDGQRITFTHNANGQILTNDTDGKRIFRNVFDSIGRVIYQDDGRSDNSLVEFRYTENEETKTLKTVATNRVGEQYTFIHNEHYQLIEEINPLGNKKTYTYDADGNVVSITDELGRTTAYSYNELGQMQEVTNALGGKEVYSYDAQGNLVSVELLDGTTWTATYDDNGALQTVTDVQGRTTNYAYTAAGLLAQATRGDKSIQYEYANGRIAQVTDFTGSVTRFTYDEAGRVVQVDVDGQVTKYTYNGADQITSVTDALGNVQQFRYDAHHNLISIVDAEGNTIETNTYNENNKLVQSKNAFGGITTYVYDGEDRLTQMIDPNGAATTYSYNAANELVSITSPDGSKSDYTVDAAGNITQITDYKGQPITTRTFNELDQITQIVDALGHTSAYEYDEAGIVTTTIDALKRSTSFTDDLATNTQQQTNADGSIVKRQYDEDGYVTSVTDENKNKTTFNYDTRHLLTSVKNSKGFGAEFTYNKLAQMIGKQNERGQQTAYRYDANGNVVEIIAPEQTLRYTYNKNNVVTKIEGDRSSVQFSYNKANALAQYTNEQGEKIAYTYTTRGELATMTYPDGKVVRYSYTPEGLLAHIIDWNNKITSYEYDANGNVVKISYPNDTYEQRTYDAANQVTAIQVFKQSGLQLLSKEYRYDAVGRTVSETSSLENKLNFNPLTISFGIGLNNELTRFDGATTIKYDRDGNVVKASINNTVSSFAYNSDNVMTKAGNEELQYDLLGNLIGMKNKAGTTQFTVNPNAQYSQLLVEKSTKGTRYYVYGAGLLGYYDEAGNYTNYYFDAVGNTMALADATGTVTDTYQYAPFGKLLQHDGNTEQPFNYSGQYGVYQLDNGLHYMRARYYNADLGRFMTVDPYAGKYSDLALLNVYAYGNNNPMLYVDPDGEWAFLIPMAKMAVSGLVNVAVTAAFSDEPLTWGKAGSAFVGGAIGVPGGAAVKHVATGGKIINNARKADAIEITSAATIGGFTQATLDEVDNAFYLNEGFSVDNLLVNGTKNTIGNIGWGLTSKGVTSGFSKAMPDVDTKYFINMPEIAGGLGYSATTIGMNGVLSFFDKSGSVINYKLTSQELKATLK